MLNRLRRHLLLMLVLLLPIQGLAGVLMLGCEHAAAPVASLVASHDGHDMHHEHDGAKPSAHAGHGQVDGSGHGQADGPASALDCDDCQLCELCASPGLAALPAHAALSPQSFSPAGETSRFASLAAERLPRPPRFAGA